MNHTISKMQHKLLRKMIRSNITQGPSHHNNIEEMFRIIVDAAADEFYEDNDATLYAFLRGRFEDAVEQELEYHHNMRDHYTPEEGEERIVG